MKRSAMGTAQQWATWAALPHPPAHLPLTIFTMAIKDGKKHVTRITVSKAGIT